MRIVILTTNSLSGLVSNRVLLERHRNKLAAVIVLPDIPRRLSNDLRKIRELIFYVPLPVLLYKAYDTILFRLCRRLALLPTVLSQTADAGIQVYRCSDPNSESTHAVLNALRPDIIINSSPSILAPSTLRMARKACLNLHAAPLPDFAGVANHFWLLIEKSDLSGGSVHEMTTVVDSGPILSQKLFRIQEHDTVNSLNVMNCYLCSLAAAEILDRDDEGALLGAAPVGVTYRSFPAWPDVMRLWRGGRKLFSRRDIIAIWSDTGLGKLTDEAKSRSNLESTP